MKTRSAPYAAGLIALSMLVQLWLSRRIPFDPDELEHLHQAYMWESGLRPFVDYIGEKPALLSLLTSALTRAIGHDTLWPYRVAFIGVGVALAIATYLFARRLLGRPSALLATAVLVSTTMFQVVTMSVRPDPLLALFMLMAFLFLQRWEHSRKAADAALAGFCAGLSCIAKLLTVPVAGLMGLWLIARVLRDPQRSWRAASTTGAWFAAGGAASAVAFVIAVGPEASGVRFLIELWTSISPRLDNQHSSIPDYLRHEPVFFGLSAVGAAVLALRRAGDGQSLLRLAALSYVVLWPMVILKAGAHIQDLLAITALGAIAIAGWLKPWLEAWTPRRAALIFAAAALVFIAEGAASTRWLLERERAFVQRNTFVMYAQQIACGGNPLAVADFLRCFRDRLEPGDDTRLSLDQQTNAMRFFSSTAGHALALSSLSLNVFSPNSRTISPPKLQSVYRYMPQFYEQLASGRAPAFEALIAVIARRSGHPHVLQPSTEGFRGNMYRFLAVDEPPAIIQLDAITLDVYRDDRRLTEDLRSEYRVLFDLASGVFFACHQRLAPDACANETVSPALSAADRLMLAALTARASPAAPPPEDRIREVLALDPSHPEAQYWLGRIARDQGRLADADARFAAAFHGSEGHDLDAALEWAAALDAAGKPSEAAAILRGLERYLRWGQGDWETVQPTAMRFSREPETLVARFRVLSKAIRTNCDRRGSPC